MKLLRLKAFVQNPNFPMFAIACREFGLDPYKAANTMTPRHYDFVLACALAVQDYDMRVLEAHVELQALRIAQRIDCMFSGEPMPPMHEVTGRQQTSSNESNGDMLHSSFGSFPRFTREADGSRKEWTIVE